MTPNTLKLSLLAEFLCANCDVSLAEADAVWAWLLAAMSVRTVADLLQDVVFLFCSTDALSYQHDA